MLTGPIAIGQQLNSVADLTEGPEMCLEGDIINEDIIQ